MKNLMEIENLRKEIDELNWAISRADDKDEVKTIMEIKRNRLAKRLTELNKINGWD